MKPVMVIGGGQFGKVVRSLLLDCGRTFAGFVDDWLRGSEIVNDTGALLPDSSVHDFDLAMAIGYRHLDTRLALFNRLRAVGHHFPTLVHPTAYVSRSASIGPGTMVMARAIVDTAADVRELAVLWPGVNISHDSVIGANTFVGPDAVICGFSSIGDSCFVGAGAVVVDDVQVPTGSFVKAASRHAGGPLPQVSFSRPTKDGSAPDRGSHRQASETGD